MIIWLPLLYNNHIKWLFLKAHSSPSPHLVSVKEIRCLWPIGHYPITNHNRQYWFHLKSFLMMIYVWNQCPEWVIWLRGDASHLIPVKLNPSLVSHLYELPIRSFHDVFIFSRTWYLKENWMLDAWYHLNVSSINCKSHPLFKRRHFFPEQSVLTVG